MKIVSQLDREGRFVAAVVADESPLEQGVYHLPGGAIDVPPPVVPPGQFARWNRGWRFEDIPGYVPPVPEDPVPPPPEPRVPCSPLYCRRMILTQGELAALTSLAMNSVSAAQWLDDFNCSTYILPADPGLAVGLAFMVSQGLFTSERRDAIVAALTAGMPETWGEPL